MNKILLLTPELPPKIGGIGRSALRLARSFHLTGNEVVLLSFSRHENIYTPPTISREQDSLTQFTILKIGPWPSSDITISEERKAELCRMFIETSVNEIRKIFCPNIIFSLTVNKLGFIGTCLAQHFEIPHVCSARGADVGSGIFRPDQLAFTRQVVEKSNAITFVNSYLKRTAELVFGNRPIFHIIRNGIAPISAHLLVDKIRIREQVRSELGFKPDDFIIGFSGTFREKKGVRYLAEAFSKLHSKNRRVKLLIVGGARTSLEREKAALLFTGGAVSLAVRNVGMIADPQEVFPYYFAMDCAVFPSIEDGLANSLLESMTAGTPVVGTDVFEDVIDNGVTGLVIPRYDSEALATACQGIMDNRQMASDFAARASLKVDSEFSALREIESYLELFRKLRQ